MTFKFDYQKKIWLSFFITEKSLLFSGSFILTNNSSGSPSNEDLGPNIERLLKNGPVLVEPVLEISPVDEKVEQIMQELKNKYINEFKHKDDEIDAIFIYKLIRNGKMVDALLVINDEESAPSFWIGKPGTALVLFFLLTGIPLAG